MLKKILGVVVPHNPAERRAEIYRDIIRECARMGGTLFGDVPKGNRREFFCLDPHTWVWHEEWKDASGQHILTTRYDVRPNGIFKAQDGQPYQPLSYEELVRFQSAVHAYRQRVHEKFDPLVAAA